MSNFHLVASAVEMRIAGLPSGKTLGDRIKLARKRRRWTQATLAARSGVSVPTIRNLERNVGQIGSLQAALAVLGRDIRRRKNEQACWEGGRRDVRFTPRWLLDEIVSALGPISLDPCSAEGSHVQAARYIFEEEDGLKTRWSGQLAFCNPPFSQAGKWLDRCYRAWAENEVDVVVALVPVRTSTRVFHDRCAGIADVLFLPGRPDFMNPFAPPGTSGQTPFGVMAICWGATPDAVRLLSARLGARHMPRDRVETGLASQKHSLCRA
nr:DNA N-6-adenine-methyltransferase [Novosphingobium panipatense]